MNNETNVLRMLSILTSEAGSHAMGSSMFSRLNTSREKNYLLVFDALHPFLKRIIYRVKNIIVANVSVMMENLTLKDGKIDLFILT